MRAQRGMSLVVSLAMLLVLSLLAMLAANTSILETKMAGGTHDAQLVRIAADSALAQARARIFAAVAELGAARACEVLRCLTREADAPTAPQDFMQTAAARSAATAFAHAGAPAGANPEVAPTVRAAYVVEYLGVEGVLTGASSSAPARHVFRVTAQGTGGAADVVRVVEAAYVVTE